MGIQRFGSIIRINSATWPQPTTTCLFVIALIAVDPLRLDNITENLVRRAGKSWPVRRRWHAQCEANWKRRDAPPRLMKGDQFKLKRPGADLLAFLKA